MSDDLFVGTPPPLSPEAGYAVVNTAHHHSAAPAPITGYGTAIGSRYNLANIGRMSELTGLNGGTPSGFGSGHSAEIHLDAISNDAHTTTYIPMANDQGFFPSGQQHRGSEEYAHIACQPLRSLLAVTTASGSRKRKHAAGNTSEVASNHITPASKKRTRVAPEMNSPHAQAPTTNSVSKKKTPVASEKNLSDTQGPTTNSEMPKQRQRAVSQNPHLVAK